MTKQQGHTQTYSQLS